MELTAAQITEQALNILGWTGFEAWRQTNNTGKRWKNNVHKGTADIVGYERNGGSCRHMECEVKKIGDKLSKEQVTHLTKIHLAGGHALVAHEVNGLVKITPFAEYTKPKANVKDI